MEEWLQIAGFEFYDVSSLGRIRSNRYGRILRPFAQGEYLGIWLGAGNKRYIHHLVADAFLEPIVCTEIDHINRNKADNRAINLRRVSPSENMRNRNNYFRIQNNVEVLVLCDAVLHG